MKLYELLTEDANNSKIIFNLEQYGSWYNPVTHENLDVPIEQHGKMLPKMLSKEDLAEVETILDKMQKIHRGRFDRYVEYSSVIYSLAFRRGWVRIVHDLQYRAFAAVGCKSFFKMAWPVLKPVAKLYQIYTEITFHILNEDGDRSKGEYISFDTKDPQEIRKLNQFIQSMK